MIGNEGLGTWDKPGIMARKTPRAKVLFPTPIGPDNKMGTPGRINFATMLA
jgi:hypothetical protein